MPSLSLSIRPELKHELRPTLGLRQSFGETIGDIPIYSLHRIKSFGTRQPIMVKGQSLNKVVLNLLWRNLLRENKKYREDSGNNKLCLTSTNLVDAIEETDRQLQEQLEAIPIPAEQPALTMKIVARLQELRSDHILAIQKWFEINFEDLRYDMSGHIPWAVVCRLRKNFVSWIVTKVNPFGVGIIEGIFDIAQEETGCEFDTAEEAWEAMGGKVFKKKLPDDED